LWTFANPCGHNITGVQNIIFLSLITTLLGFRGTLDAADATDPTRRLLVSLITDSWFESCLEMRLVASYPSLRLSTFGRIVVYLSFGGILIIN
jgi:hypothetical protein